MQISCTTIHTDKHLSCLLPLRKYNLFSFEIQNFKPLSHCVGWFVPDLIINPEDRFSCEVPKVFSVL